MTEQASRTSGAWTLQDTEFGPVGPQKHRWFDDWRGAQGSALTGLVAEVRSAVLDAEATSGARRRKRRPIDEHHHRLAVEVVVANLAHAVLMPPELGRLALLTRNGERGRTRYENPALGKPVRTLLFHLSEGGLLDLRGDGRRGEASSIAPTDAFARRIRALGIGLGDFRRLPKEETIILTRKSRGRWTPFEAPTGTRSLVDYAETAETTDLRDRLTSLNRYVEAASVAFVDDGRGAVDQHDRTQRRHFTTAEETDVPSFDRTGRFFGGFSQNLGSDRRHAIRIDGEGVADLDYASLYPRLAFASVGIEPPTSDLYDIPGLGEHRGALKRAMNCLLMDDFTRRSWPAEFTGLIPDGWTVAKVRGAILRHHPALAPCLGIGLGLRLMKTESDILLVVLEEARARGIVGLGLHDGLMVADSRADETRSLMEVVGREISSVHLPVTRKA